MRIFWIVVIFMSIYITSAQGALQQYKNDIYYMPKVDIDSYQLTESKQSNRQHIANKILKKWQDTPSLLIKLIVNEDYSLEKAIKFRKKLISIGIDPYNISVHKKNENCDIKNNNLLIQLETVNKKIKSCNYHKDNYLNHKNKLFGCAVNSNLSHSLI